jgi:hypothetical protein
MRDLSLPRLAERRRAPGRRRSIQAGRRRHVERHSLDPQGFAAIPVRVGTRRNNRRRPIHVAESLEAAIAALRKRQTQRLTIGVAVRRREEDDVSVARLTLYSHHFAKLDRSIAQPRRRASRRGGELAGVEVEIDAAGGVSVHAPNMEPLVLHVATSSMYHAPPLAAPLGQE